MVQSWNEQIVTHGREVQQSTEKDKTVPDGMRKRYQSVTLEEDDAKDVDRSTDRHLVNTRVFILTTNTHRPRPHTSNTRLVMFYRQTVQIGT